MQAFEPLFNQYGVDLVMHGHVHAYERTNRVYNYQNSPCAPMYITVGKPLPVCSLGSKIRSGFTIPLMHYSVTPRIQSEVEEIDLAISTCRGQQDYGG